MPSRVAGVARARSDSRTESTAGWLMASGHALVAQQCVDLRLAAAEGLEAVHRVARAADLEDVLQIALAGGGIEHAFHFKRAPGIGAQQLSPFVAVIAGRIAAGEDVREAVLEAVEGRRRDDGHL